MRLIRLEEQVHHSRCCLDPGVALIDDVLIAVVGFLLVGQSLGDEFVDKVDAVVEDGGCQTTISEANECQSEIKGVSRVYQMNMTWEKLKFILPKPTGQVFVKVAW